jgi:His-Xaa-Ser system protein HxsD
MKNQINGNEIVAYFESSLFSKEAILKCLYWYGDKFHVNFSILDVNIFIISLKPLSNSNIKENELELYLQKLERDIIDFQLRDTIVKETHNVRDMLIAKAFSNGEFDEEPPGVITDPVGFNPN